MTFLAQSETVDGYELLAQVIRCETPTLSARRRSSIFEETLTPDPSVCRWLLEIISEDDALLDDKLNITDQIDAYNKTEADALLDDN
ncbi:MAG: hypothetical protein EZS28_030557 [Streblomastix strix]|uniref:Uncharacterized protein n=1 Tax=Streblomastix strix TaxID=222440 RepID=A0A5J4UVW4_9EUKA|nr:MAG: hypothetical protein EZS28_030557 [Streblomastix strix]